MNGQTTDPMPNENSQDKSLDRPPQREAEIQPKKEQEGPARWLGNVAQWIAAVATLGTLWIAYVGLHEAQLYFQTENLKEENAELRIANRDAERQLRQVETAIVDAKLKTWTFACQIVTARITEPLSIQAVSFDFVLKAQALGGAFRDDLGPGELGYRFGFIPGVKLEEQTVPKLVEFTLNEVDLSFLSDSDADRFRRELQDFVNEHRQQLDIPLFIPVGESTATGQISDARERWTSAIRSAQDLVSKFRSDCEHSASR